MSGRVGGNTLYLVFDDWSRGYSFRKVNPRRRRATVRRLPRPFLRLEARPGSPDCFASAFGTMILSMHARNLPQLAPDDSSWSGTGIPILDVSSRAISFGPWLEYHIDPIYLAVGDDKLFTLCLNSFEVLSVDRSGGGMEWSWQLLPKRPFEVYDVSSYALHPD